MRPEPNKVFNIDSSENKITRIKLGVSHYPYDKIGKFARFRKSYL